MNNGGKMDKFDFYFKVLARYDQYINLANTKAANHINLLGTLSIAATALLGWGLNLDTTSGIKINTPQTFLIIAYIAFIVSSIMWYTTCMEVIKPNTKDSKDGNTSIPSSIFFGSVDSFQKFSDFKAFVSPRSDDEHFEDLLNQVHTLAHITNHKFIAYSKVNKFVLFSFIFLLALLLISAVTRLG